MSERQNMFVYAFEPHSPRITADDINEWIYDTMCLREDGVAMIQIDGPRRHVYIKLRDAARTQELLTAEPADLEPQSAENHSNAPQRGDHPGQRRGTTKRRGHADHCAQ